MWIWYEQHCVDKCMCWAVKCVCVCVLVISGLLHQLHSPRLCCNAVFPLRVRTPHSLFVPISAHGFSRTNSVLIHHSTACTFPRALNLCVGHCRVRRAPEISFDSLKSRKTEKLSRLLLWGTSLLLSSSVQSSGKMWV